jgi:hypothetical protein
MKFKVNLQAFEPAPVSCIGICFMFHVAPSCFLVGLLLTVRSPYSCDLTHALLTSERMKVLGARLLSLVVTSRCTASFVESSRVVYAHWLL